MARPALRMPRRPRLVWTSFIVLFTLAALAAVWLYANSQVVATVNGERITRSEMYHAMYARSGRDVLEEVINKRLILQEAKAKDVVVEPAELEAEISKIIANFGSEEAFLETLKVYGLTREFLEEEIRVELLSRKLVMAQVTVTEEEAMAFFSDNRQLFDEHEAVRFSHLLVATAEEAAAAMARLEAGESLGKLAEELSLDYYSRFHEGDVGYVERGDLVPELEEVLFGMALHELSSPVETIYGFHIMLVTGRKEAKTASYEEVREEVLEYLKSTKAEQVASQWMWGLRAAASVKYR
ncbi:MAG: peptidyl-prolyl cis-trans isomerase [Bacillota bacterium]